MFSFCFLVAERSAFSPELYEIAVQALFLFQIISTFPAIKTILSTEAFILHTYFTQCILLLTQFKRWMHMSFIVHIKNKNNNSVYAYEVESYRDPVTKKARQHRTYLGRVSPETGEIIKKKETRHSRKDSSSQQQSNTYSEDHESQLQTIKELSDKLDKLQKQYETLVDALMKMKDVISSVSS